MFVIKPCITKPINSISKNHILLLNLLCRVEFLLLLTNLSLELVNSSRSLVVDAKIRRQSPFDGLRQSIYDNLRKTD